ncbi:MAG TPA: lysophospholipid acyltransferase family protein [Bacteroidales bacterium]|jgi:1-acyl-sn-glycerol-3-phosphate acyltransferase|nr:lysophospholipid acyltransferase family protein [Bacteroidales bacterium]
MIKAKHHFVIYPFFQFYTKYLIRKNFDHIELISDFKDNGLPILIIANHISWWDGFWIMHLNLNLIHRKFHFMMLENQLKKHWYFNYSGAFSVNPGSRSVMESIDYAVTLLHNPRNMIFMFPQGAINSIYNDKIIFKNGIEKIIQKSNNEIQIILLANFVDYFSNPKPTVFMYLKGISSYELKNQDIRLVYNQFYVDSLETQKNKIS